MVSNVNLRTPYILDEEKTVPGLRKIFGRDTLPGFVLKEAYCTLDLGGWRCKVDIQEPTALPIITALMITDDHCTDDTLKVPGLQTLIVKKEYTVLST